MIEDLRGLCQYSKAKQSKAVSRSSERITLSWRMTRVGDSVGRGALIV